MKQSQSPQQSSQSHSCLFCNPAIINAGQLAETDFFYIVADINPVSPGHLLIISKRHIETFFELNKAESAELITAINQAKDLSHSDQLHTLYQKNLKQSFSALSKKRLAAALENWDKKITGFNLKVNNGVSAGQKVFHLHIHLVPRFDGDKKTVGFIESGEEN